MKEFLVTGLGQCCWDYLAVADGYPPADSKCEVTGWTGQGGGPVATALVALARLGVACRFAGVVGDDDLGGKIRQSLAEEGIDTAGVVIRAGGLSQRAFILIGRQQASRTIFWQRPTGAPLRPEELSAELLEESRFLLLDGLMVEASLYAAGAARERGIPVMLDAGRVRPGMLELARLCDYLVAGEQFFLDLGWDGSAPHFQRLAADFPARAVTVTLGDRGSFTWHAGTLMPMAAFPVEVLDTTGAGDVFHGGYLFGLLQDWPLADTLAFASALASLSCTRIGGRCGIPGLEEALRFLAERGHPLAAASATTRRSP